MTGPSKAWGASFARAWGKAWGYQQQQIFELGGFGAKKTKRKKSVEPQHEIVVQKVNDPVSVRQEPKISIFDSKEFVAEVARISANIEKAMLARQREEEAISVLMMLI